jgi:hypothetical protein
MEPFPVADTKAGGDAANCAETRAEHTADNRTMTATHANVDVGVNPDTKRRFIFALVGLVHL